MGHNFNLGDTGIDFLELWEKNTPVSGGSGKISFDLGKNEFFWEEYRIAGEK
jgi:hypothetical protein